MQADVARDRNQQARIAQGAASGTLSDREVASLEHGQARDARTEANVAANGRIGALEQDRVQHRENAQSARIYHRKHD
jgi:hypothetical protein